MNLKQATVLSEFQGLPLMKLAKENAAEPKYDVKQAMHKLTSTTWTNSEQLMKFYESNRDLYTSKPKDNQELSDVMVLYRSQLENLRKVSYSIWEGRHGDIQSGEFADFDGKRPVKGDAEVCTLWQIGQ
jgi:hypothetical protein